MQFGCPKGSGEEVKEPIPVDEVARFDGGILTHRALKRQQPTMKALVCGDVGKIELKDIPNVSTSRPMRWSHCEGGGWILGHLINGTQAEYVRIPHADNSLHHVPSDSNEDALVMLSDILPTGHEIRVLNGGVKPGDTIAIVGAGPIGMPALLTSQF